MKSKIGFLLLVLIVVVGFADDGIVDRDSPNSDAPESGGLIKKDKWPSPFGAHPQEPLPPPGNDSVPGNLGGANSDPKPESPSDQIK